MDTELNVSPKQKAEAKECLLSLLRENGMYDELYVRLLRPFHPLASGSRQSRPDPPIRGFQERE